MPPDWARNACGLLFWPDRSATNFGGGG